MGETKHTPGPWGVTTERSFRKPLIWIYRPRAAGGVEATIYDAESPDVFPLSAADARLIAAAPALLERLEGAVMFCNQDGSPIDGFRFREEVLLARALIARVKGEHDG